MIYKPGQVYVNPMVDEAKAAARRMKRNQNNPCADDDDDHGGESSPEEEYWFDAASPRRPQIKKHLRTSGQRGHARRGGDGKAKRIFHKFEPQQERKVPSAAPNSSQQVKTRQYYFF